MPCDIYAQWVPLRPKAFFLFTFPHVASGRNSGFDVIFFCLGKRPGGSDSNRVFSMSEPKSEFFRGTLFFQVENLGEKVEETLKIVKSEQL